tara:strand:- start:198 stop:620 length:423 start_codon:yes stop_codon:yes gene_type:complete
MAKISKVVRKTTKAVKKNQPTSGQKAAATKKRNQALAKGRQRSRTAGLVGAGAILTSTPIIYNASKKKANQTTKTEVNKAKPGELTGFGKAFKSARKKGLGTTFTYNNKKYVAVTKDDLSKKNMTLNQFVKSKRNGLRQK